MEMLILPLIQLGILVFVVQTFREGADDDLDASSPVHLLNRRLFVQKPLQGN